MDVDLIRSYVDVLVESTASEVYLKSGDLEIRLSFAPGAVASPALAGARKAEVAGGADDVTASLPGLVYLAPAPDADPFIDRGMKVEQGDTLLLVEAMKSMQPLLAPAAGIVEDILVRDGDSVLAGQVVVRLRAVPA